MLNGKYLMLLFDKDVQLFLDKLNSECEELNYNFEYKNKNTIINMDVYKDLIDKEEDLNENWYPTKNRFDYLLKESGINPDEYFEDRLKTIASHRESGLIKSGKKYR